jgi:RimJ/RimL family protein N-acetyltransferase
MGTVIKLFEEKDWYNIKDPVDSFAYEPDMKLIKERGLTVTLTKDNVVQGCGGAVLYDENNAELWLRLSKKVNKFIALDAVCECFKYIISSLGNMNIYCRVKSGFKKGKRLVKHLGFKYDRVLDDYEVYKWSL